MAYNPNSYFNYEAGRGSIYSSPPKSKPKNANEQAAKSMGSAGIGGLGGRPTTTAAQKIQDNFREQTQKESGSSYDEIALPTEAEVDKKVKGLGSPDKPDDDKDQSPIEKIKSTFDSVSEMMGLGKPEKPKRAAYTPEKIYNTAAFRARSNDPIDLDAQNRRINAAVDFGNRAPMAYLPAGGTYDEITKQRGADERSQQKMAESINATIAQLYAANDPARQFYQSNVPMDQRIFEPEIGYDEIALPSEATVDKKIKGLGARPDVTVTELDYTVESGDTLSEIAQANGTTVEEILRLNDDIEDKDVITTGQEITIPNTSPQTQQEMLDTDIQDVDYETVEAAQQRLTDLGYTTTAGDLVVDGDLGPGTARQLKKLQKTAGIPMTGELDTATKKALKNNKNNYKDKGLSIAKTNEIKEDIPDSLFEKIKAPIAQIESGGEAEPYLVAGGSGDHYDGKYQLGKEAKNTIKNRKVKDANGNMVDVFTAAEKTKLNHTAAGRADFRSDSALQEKAFKELVKANHFTMTRYSEKYRNASMEEKLGILGYTHNQGNENTLHYLHTGVVGVDGNGTKGTKYSDAILEEFDIDASAEREENL